MKFSAFISSRETCRKYLTFIKLLGKGRVENHFSHYTSAQMQRFLFMKKIIALLLSLIICVSFCSCGKTPDANLSQKTIGENTGTTENVSTLSEQENESISQNANESVPQITSKPDNKPKPTENGNSETKKDTSHSETGTAPTAATTESTAKPNAKISCTVQVECKKILSKKNKFKKDLSLIPDDGVIMPPVKVYLDEGATAYDALKKGCDENGIPLNVQNSSFGGVYVVGIGGIEEKDCGSQSGWIYSVNGQSPGEGMGKYVIKNGDSVVLSYVC